MNARSKNSKWMIKILQAPAPMFRIVLPHKARKAGGLLDFPYLAASGAAAKFFSPSLSSWPSNYSPL
jgi:hypothetical protein